MSSTAEDTRQRPDDTDSVRARFNELAARDGRPLAQIAPETSVSYPTLHAFKTGTYKGDNARIAKQLQVYMNTREAREKTRTTMRADPGFVMTKTASRMWEVLEFAQTMPDMVMISGGAGIGKSTAIKAYAESASNVFIATAEPAHNTVPMVLMMLAEAVGSLLDHRGAYMSQSIRKRLIGTRGLLIVDEAQHLPPSGRDQIRSTVFDMAGIGVALVGSDGMDKTFQSERAGGKHAQLISRVGQRFSRERPLKSDIETLLDAWGIGDDQARTVGIGIALKPGALRQLVKTLRMSFALADARGDEAPNADDIIACYQQLGGMV